MFLNRERSHLCAPDITAAPGGEPSDAAALWKHAAEDRSAMITSGIGKPWVGAGAGGREGKVSGESVRRAAGLGYRDFLAAAEKSLESKPGVCTCKIRRSWYPC